MDSPTAITPKIDIALLHELERGGSARTRRFAPGIAFAWLLALVGLVMVIYLISSRGAPRDSGDSKAQPSKETIMVPAKDNGIVSKPSHHSVDDTVERLKALLQAKGVTVFAVVDHSGEAQKAGLNMPPTKLLIFGSPKAGTPLMLAAPSIAIDLPLKILVAADSAGNVTVSYNSPAYLQQRHAISDALVQNIAVVEMFAAKAAE